MKQILTVLLLSSVVISGCTSQKIQKDTDTKLEQEVSDLQSYENELYSFSHPKDFTTQLELQNKVLTISNGDSKIELFKMEDFGDRPFGFSGEETQQDLDQYTPKETLAKDGYDIWLYYPQGDIKTKEKLIQIVDSIQVK